MENCPRCEARSKTSAPLVFSPPADWGVARPVGTEPMLPPTRVRSNPDAAPVGL